MQLYAPRVSSLYNLKARLEDDNISSKNALTVLGIPCPPYFGSQDKEVHPSLINFLYASLYPGGVLTTPFSKTVGFSSPDFASGRIKF